MNRLVNLNNTDMRMPMGAGAEPRGLLSRITSIGTGLSSTTTFFIVIFLVFSIIAAIYIFYYLPSLKASYKPNSEHVQSGSNQTSGKDAELILFYVDWCPHCKTAKPVWDDLKSQYENKTINGYKVLFTEYNCTEETAEVEQMMNKYNIEGFPTIKLLKDGQIIEYDAKPTKETLVQFLNTVL